MFTLVLLQLTVFAALSQQTLPQITIPAPMALPVWEPPVHKPQELTDAIIAQILSPVLPVLPVLEVMSPRMPQIPLLQTPANTIQTVSQNQFDKENQNLGVNNAPNPYVSDTKKDEQPASAKNLGIKSQSSAQSAKQVIDTRAATETTLTATQNIMKKDNTLQNVDQKTPKADTKLESKIKLESNQLTPSQTDSEPNMQQQQVSPNQIQQIQQIMHLQLPKIYRLLETNLFIVGGIAIILLCAYIAKRVWRKRKEIEEKQEVTEFVEVESVRSHIADGVETEPV